MLQASAFTSVVRSAFSLDFSGLVFGFGLILVFGLVSGERILWLGNEFLVVSTGVLFYNRLQHVRKTSTSLPQRVLGKHSLQFTVSKKNWSTTQKLMSFSQLATFPCVALPSGGFVNLVEVSFTSGP